MTYVDGFLLAVPKANLEAYKAMARTAGAVWKEHGAIDYVECVGDDVPYGELTSFPRAVQASDDEIVIFSWITYESRAQRDAILAKVMADARLQGDDWKDVFDGKRMIYGGFAPILDEGEGGAMGYLDGVLVAVPDERKAAYRDFSAGHAALFKEYGARRVVDAWGDDVPDGKLTDFKGAVKAQAGETVVFSWVEWPSREVRAAAWGKMMSDPRMATLEMPFDGKRVVYGGFAPILDTARG